MNDETMAARTSAQQAQILIESVKTSDLDSILGRKVSMKDGKGCYERTGVLMIDPLTEKYIVVVHARTPWDIEGSFFYLPLSLDKIYFIKISGDGKQINLATNIRYATGVFDHHYDIHMGKIRDMIRTAK